MVGRMDRVEKVLGKEEGVRWEEGRVTSTTPRQGEVYRDKNTLVEVTIHRREARGEVGGRSSAPEAGVVEGRRGRVVEREEGGRSKRTRSVGELVRELRQIVAESGVGEVSRAP